MFDLPRLLASVIRMISIWRSSSLELRRTPLHDFCASLLEIVHYQQALRDHPLPHREQHRKKIGRILIRLSCCKFRENPGSGIRIAIQQNDFFSLVTLMEHGLHRFSEQPDITREIEDPERVKGGCE
jgi:hypothetical protein